MKGIIGRCISLLLDLIEPIGSIKSAIEIIIGRDFLTQEKFNFKERLICFIGAIPLIGNNIKIIKGASKFAKAFIHCTKVAEKIDDIYTTSVINDIYEVVITSFRGIENSISEMVDFIKYDISLVATLIRTTFGIICIIIVPIISLINNFAKAFYYGYWVILGKTKEEMDKSLGEIGDNFYNKYDEFINKLDSKGFNGRFIKDIGFVFIQFIDYYNITKLSEDGKKKVQGLQNEAIRKYNENKNRQEFDPYKDIINNNKWKNYNNTRYKFNREIEQAKKNAIRYDLKRYARENKHPLFGKSMLKGVLVYLWGLIKNILWIIKSNFINYWKNKFGNEDYGFQGYPYYDGRSQIY